MLEGLERRHVEAGQVIVRAGTESALTVIVSGSAEVYLTDGAGADRVLAVVGPGQSLGEMALFTREAATASARALTDLEVLCISPDEFHRMAAAFPRLYVNLGAIVAERLRQANRRVIGDPTGTLLLLSDHGAPADLAASLAASVAWHTKGAVLLVDASGRGEQAGRGDHGDEAPAPRPGHAVHTTVPSDVGASRLPGLLERFRRSFDHVLVRVAPADAAAIGAARRIALVGTGTHGDDPACEYRVVGWCHAPVPTRTGVLRGEVRVPHPSEDERPGITDGALPLSGRAGRVLGWVARDLAGLKVGLALGAGSVRGFAHIGVLRVLERAGLPVDYLAGSSIGAPVAGMLATGDSADAIEEKLRRVGTATFRPTLPRHSILSSAGVRDVMRGVWGERRIEDLDTPLGIVAVDIESRRQVVFRSGPLWAAALASIAIPGVYPPVRIASRTLVDGGVLNPVPIDVVGAMGADHVVGVRLGDLGPTDRLEDTASAPSAAGISILQVLMRSIDAMQAAVNIAPASVRSTVIEPSFPPSAGFALRDFAQGAQYVEHGRVAAERALDRLRLELPWLQ
jgi:NTE family protein